MVLKQVLHIILILTLLLQVLPATPSGRLLFFDIAEECTDCAETAKKQVRQVEEEQYKEFFLHNTSLKAPSSASEMLMVCLSEKIPAFHYGSIHTPPPNVVS